MPDNSFWNSQDIYISPDGKGYVHSDGSALSKEDYDYIRYMNEGGGLGEFGQGTYNFLSNPVGGIEQVGRGGNLSDNYSGQGTGLTNPMNVDLKDQRGARNGAMTRDVFQSMTDADWAAFRNLPRDQQNAWITQRHNDLTTGKLAKDQADAVAAAKAKQEAEYQKWRQATLTRLDAFSKDMGRPLDQLLASGDLGARAAVDTGANQAATAAYGRGLGGGGLSTQNTQRAALSAGLGYQNQRYQMGLQATQGLMTGLNQEYMNNEDRRRYEQGLNLQLQQAQAGQYNQKYLQQQQQQAGLMGMVGTVFGGAFGGAAGAQAGGQLGQAYGASSYGQQNPYQPYQYQYPSGSGQSLGGGSTNGGWGGWKPTNQQ